MTPRTFPTTLVLTFALAMALIVGASGAVIYASGRRAAYDAQVRDLDHLTALVREWVPRQSEPAPDDRQRVVDAANVLALRVTLIAGDGRVLLDTHEPVEVMGNHNDRPEVRAARAGGVGSDRRRSATLERPSLYVARLLDLAMPGGVVVRISDPLYEPQVLTGAAWAAFAGSAAAAGLTGVALWLLMRREWVDPLRRLSATADQMAAGQWQRRATTDGAEHVRLFASKLNAVAAHAERQMADLKRQGEDLRALVDALPDPILVADPQSRITLMNSPAASVLDVTAERAVGQKLVSIVAEVALLELFEDAQRVEPVSRRVADQADGVNGASISTDAAPPIFRTVRLTRGGQRLTYQAVAGRTGGGGVLIVLRDVTTLSAAVQMKTDFVANASHELRTPIAAIKIAFETLVDVYQDDPPQAARCIEIVDGHVRRLEEMLRDLLDLSRVESPELKPFVKDVRTADLFALVRSGLGAMSSRKLVELRFSGEPTGPATLPTPQTFFTDERLLNLVLKNLVENAIKFTPPGGSVTVAVHPGEADGDGRCPVVLSVTDTGIGIPPQHLDRVFERFYQVDASRTGSAGRGTGLGLAIVKHAVAALGGTVELRSTIGTGTTVTCSLPQNGATREPLPELAGEGSG
jgi:two-component system phosphate regulon sensor histidine kinase PhoR